MALCPNCANEVKLPWHTYLSGLPHHLSCPHCKSRLERTTSGSATVLASLVMLVPLFHPFSPLARRAGIAVIALLTGFSLFQIMRPKLRLRTKPPEPDVFLKI
jgi:hypothetical protein